jgi:hypothetical protein
VPELSKVFSNMFGRSISVKLDVIGRIQPQSIVSSPPPKPPEPTVIEPPAIPTPVVDRQPEVEQPPERKIAPPEPPVIAEPEPLPPVDVFELEPQMDFAEPPDSIDLERAANTPENEPEDPDIDPDLQRATDNIVKVFNGEIISRTHDLFDKIVDD